MAEPHIEEHSSPIQTPKQLVVVVLLAFLIPVLGIVLLVQLITGGMNIDRSSATMSEEAVAKRLKPVGEVRLAESAPAAAGTRSGEAVYTAVCAACHGAGLLNAPKPGDQAAWKPRIAQGEKTLVQHAINGIRQMPARGGNPNLSDLEVERAVVYMANKSGASFSEPAAPAKAAASSQPAAPAATAAPASTIAAPGSGEKVYNAVCHTCHATGLAGAPKFGDKGAWKPRIAQGRDTLYAHALNGIRAMPPKGGAMGTPDADIKAAVDYMVAHAK